MWIEEPFHADEYSSAGDLDWSLLVHLDLNASDIAATPTRLKLTHANVQVH